MISREDVLAAREAIGGRLHRTPLFSSKALSERIGAEAHLKAELFQRTGSFKPRGMLAKLASLSADEKSRGIVTWSAGNAAQGAAYAASLDGVACRVFMWRTANPRKVEAARAYGADVDLDAEGPAEAHERLLAYAEETGRVFVHPFDDPVLQAGHGSLGLEVEEDVPGVGTIVVPIGGGGLDRRRRLGRRLSRRRRRAGDGGDPHRGARRRRAGSRRAEIHRRRAERAVHGRAHARRRPRARGRDRARLRGRDRRRDAVSLRPREARVRAGRGRRRRPRCWPARSRSSPVPRSSPSCREATRTRRSLLLSSPRPDED